MSIWIIKCREVQEDGSQGWHWGNYFGWDGPNEPFYFGRNQRAHGDDWIKSRSSKKYIRDEVRKGDLIVCYQYEGRKICGLTRMASDGQKADGSGEYNWFFLSSPFNKESLHLKRPLRISELRSTGCDPRYFREGQGTIFPFEPDKFNGMLAAILKFSPGIRPNLVKWVRNVGYSAEI